MAYTIDIPFYAIELSLPGGKRYVMPMLDSQAMRTHASTDKLAQEYQDLLQKKQLNQGDFIGLLTEHKKGDFIKKTVDVSFKAAKDGRAFPAFSLKFQYFYTVSDANIWGFIPALGMEIIGQDIAEIEERITSIINLEFSRNRRLRGVKNIVSSAWYNELKLNQTTIALKLPSPEEIVKSTSGDTDAMLPKIADKLSFTKTQSYGRKAELNQFAKFFKSQFIKNTLLVGNNGVGKTALIYELAKQRKKLGIKTNIWETTASRMIKELVGETGWQDGIIPLIQELKLSGDCLYVKNLAELFEVGQYQGNDVSVAAFMRSAIARGDVHLVSECTEEELSKIELKSPGFGTLFNIVRLEVPKKAELEEIILKKVKDIAGTQRVRLEDDAIQEVIRLNIRYTPYSGLPGKPIRFLESLLLNRPKSKKGKVTKSEIIKYFCQDTGMPPFIVDPTIAIQLPEVKDFFKQNIYGQAVAVDKIVDIIATVKTSLTSIKKPIASMLFVGPTGVGKTELAKVMAQFMFGHRNRMVRFDMSEYSTPGAVMRLTGAGGQGNGLLTSAVRKEPFSVLLFDEIEKADGTFYDLLLQLLSEGRLSDRKGKTVNFCSTIIVMTSNIGAGNLQTNRISWSNEMNANEISEHFMSAVKKHFRPELFNRIDHVLPFEPLTAETIRYVVDREIAQFRQREGILFRKLDLNMPESVMDWLSANGYDPKFGARKIQRTIRESLLIPLSKGLNIYDFSEHIIVNVSVVEDALSFEIEEDPLGFDLLLEELEVSTLADITSDLRRSINILVEKPVFIKMQSDLNMLYYEIEDNEKRFWADGNKTSLFNKYTAILEKQKAMAAEVEAHEQTLALNVMSLAPYNSEIEQSIDTWKDDYFNFKKEIYQAVQDNTDICHLHIYGINPEFILPLYQALIQAKGFQVSAEAILFDEGHYSEVISHNDEDNQVVTRAIRAEYLSESVRLEERNWQSTDFLMGLKLTIVGDCCYLYLTEEEGLQVWVDEDGKEHSFFIKIANKSISIPENIHRKEFYKTEKPRRIFSKTHVKDTRYKWNRDVKTGELLELVQEELSGRFEQALERVFE